MGPVTVVDAFFSDKVSTTMENKDIKGTDLGEYNFMSYWIWATSALVQRLQLWKCFPFLKLDLSYLSLPQVVRDRQADGVLLPQYLKD